MSCVTVKEIVHSEYGKCIRIANHVVELICTVDFGPRIIHYSFIGKDNLFREGDTSGVMYNDDAYFSKWKLYGGHRLWHSPEHYPRNYVPDNDPVEWKRVEDGIALCQKTEPWTQIKKEIVISINKDDSCVKIDHYLTNKNAWEIEIGIFASTVMKDGGVEIVPHIELKDDIVANRVITLWPYTSMGDNRVTWGEKYIVIRHEQGHKRPFKFGVKNEQGWAAYVNNGTMFIKRFSKILNAKYPDYGVNFETYTNDNMLEMESFSPLVRLNLDQKIKHTEYWELIQGVSVIPNNEDDIDKIVKRFQINREGRYKEC